MNQPPAADSVIRERLEQLHRSLSGQTLGEAKAVESVASRDGRVAVELVLGFPCADYVPEMQAALQKHLGTCARAMRGWS